MEFVFPESEDNVPEPAQRYNEHPHNQIILAREDGEVLGFGVYREENGEAAIEYGQVFDEHQGVGIAAGLLESSMRYADEADVDSIYSLDTTMDGRVQHLLQDRQFEASGFKLDNSVSDIAKRPGGGFNVEFWKTDAEVEAYLPEVVQDFTDESLADQREIDYVQLESPERTTGSIDIIQRKVNPKKATF